MEHLGPIIVISNLISMFVGWYVGNLKRAGATGILLGLLLGPLGVLITAFVDQRPQCAICKTRVNSGALACPACGRWLTWAHGEVVSAYEGPRPITPPPTPAELGKTPAVAWIVLVVGLAAIVLFVATR